MDRSMLECYRVPIYRGEIRLLPIVAATSPEEAHEKAVVLGQDLLRKRLPWLMERGLRKPQPEDLTGIVIGLPELAHLRGTH